MAWIDQNPRLLIPSIERQCPHNDLQPDAIFVPFRKGSTKVHAVLHELDWYDGMICLMPSDIRDVQAVRTNKDNVHILNYSEDWFLDFFWSLRTSKMWNLNNYANKWDLPIKRTYALWFAHSIGLETVLLIDDDIRGLTKEILNRGANALTSYELAGCFIEDFPDTSVLGHLINTTGNSVHTFLSGSFLFMRVSDRLDFFPLLYNEDWLFMLSHILNRSICSFGSMRQLEYDPFADLQTARFQEFGEVVIEGLYALIEAGQYHDRFSEEFWSSVIDNRREILRRLSAKRLSDVHRRFIDYMLEVNLTISPRTCRAFTESWESDLGNWRNQIGKSNIRRT